MLPRGTRVLVEAVVVADSGAGAVLVEVRGPAGIALPPVAILAASVHPVVEDESPGRTPPTR